jgi:hypothetical protein
MERKEAEKPAKKKYERPNLFVYGDIRKITQTVGSGAINDGNPGTPGKSKSH